MELNKTQFQRIHVNSIKLKKFKELRVIEDMLNCIQLSSSEFKLNFTEF